MEFDKIINSKESFADKPSKERMIYLRRVWTEICLWITVSRVRLYQDILGEYRAGQILSRMHIVYTVHADTGLKWLILAGLDM